MTIDPEKIRKIADVCVALSNSASTVEEHDTFAELARSWLELLLIKRLSSQLI